MKRFGSGFLVLLIGAGAVWHAAWADPPSMFDLRNVDGQNYVSSVKSQQGGTCWTHGAMAAIEGNLLMTGNWSAAGESGEPNLAEYHLDWWNGFNEYNNDDIDPPSGGGLVVHEGGDYRVTSAYLSRGEGAVREVDGQSFTSPPARYKLGYHYYYPRNIEWYVVGEDLSDIDTVKEKIMTYGVLGTCMCYDAMFMSGTYTHYQPPTSSLDPNHAVAIVGWDDSKVTQAPLPGAWLVKNSWGTSWGLSGYFWISYYDKHCGKHPEMGAISFQNVEPMRYDHVYYHDYHGWRDTKTDCSEAFNAFTAVGAAQGKELLRAVSFFTAADNVAFTVKVYDRFEGGVLLDELAVKTGQIEHTGFHTIDLDQPVTLSGGDDFYVYLSLSAGGHPFDRTSDVPVLLGASYRTIVESSGKPGESYFYDGAGWVDFYGFNGDTTANFCIKALSVDQPFLNINFPEGRPEYIEPGAETAFQVQIVDGGENYMPGSGMLYYRYDGGDFLTSPLALDEGDLYEATLPPADCGDIPEFYISAEGVDKSVVLSPPGAPDSVYTAVVGTLTMIMADDFETNQNWIATNLGATSGNWQRGIPVNDPDWEYDPIADADGSGQCYLTQNEFGNTDVDGGAVRLYSPVFDMSTGGSVAYDYYLYLTNTDGGVDKLLVEISDDGGVSNWFEVARHVTDGGLFWRHHEITEAEITAAGASFTSSMRVRFTANDDDPQSIVEAGLDAFSVYKFDCEPAALCGDANRDDVINILDITYLINYVYLGGPAPDPLEMSNVNGDGAVNLLDITYLISYLYKGGPAPNCP
jgi:C1A family cysteine protease